MGGTIFIIGADPRIVRNAIEFRYEIQGKIEEDSNNRIVDDYLEKLIQIPYNLPRLSDSEVETYISLLICKRELEEEEFKNVYEAFQNFRLKDRYTVYGFAAIKSLISEESQKKLSKSLVSIPSIVPIITQSLFGNPRQVKRFLNTLTLRQRLATVARLTDFNDAILAKLMVLEYSELSLFKQLYDSQSSQSGVSPLMKQLEEIIKAKPSVKEMKFEIENQENLKNWAKDNVIRWLKVEPQLSDIDLSDYFWLSRDRIASAIPGSSLIPPIVKSIYQQINQDSMTEAITKKIIKEKVGILPDHELTVFLDFCKQMLIRNPKNKRGYDIFHFLMEEKIKDSENVYANTLSSVAQKDIPPAIGLALKKYKGVEVIKKYIDNSVMTSETSFAKAYKTK